MLMFSNQIKRKRLDPNLQLDLLDLKPQSIKGLSVIQLKGGREKENLESSMKNQHRTTT